MFLGCIITAITWRCKRNSDLFLESQVPMSFFHMHVHDSTSLFIQSFGLFKSDWGELHMACSPHRLSRSISQCGCFPHLQKACQIVCTNFCPLLLSLLAKNLKKFDNRNEETGTKTPKYSYIHDYTCILENMVRG